MIRKETIHPEGDSSVDIYPKTSFDQVEGKPDMNDYQKKNDLEQDIEDLGYNKVIANTTETGSTDLTKLKVGDSVYNIPSGGGSLYVHLLTFRYTNTDDTYIEVNIRFLSTNYEPVTLNTIFSRNSEIIDNSFASYISINQKTFDIKEMIVSDPEEMGGIYIDIYYLNANNEKDIWSIYENFNIQDYIREL